MDIKNAIMPPKPQERYRSSQNKKGLVRYEIQVKAKSKQKFEELVAAAADEHQTPWSKRQRLAKAREEIFDQVTQGIKHDFYELKNQIEVLKQEITALSPSYFHTEPQNNIPLPQAIKSLPDDPQALKSLLAKIYKQLQDAKYQNIEYKRQADQYEKLYSTLYDENESLSARLEEQEAEEF
jgi:hypothetical protein